MDSIKSQPPRRRKGAPIPSPGKNSRIEAPREFPQSEQPSQGQERMHSGDPRNHATGQQSYENWRGQQSQPAAAWTAGAGAQKNSSSGALVFGLVCGLIVIVAAAGVAIFNADSSEDSEALPSRPALEETYTRDTWTRTPKPTSTTRETTRTVTETYTPTRTSESSYDDDSSSGGSSGSREQFPLAPYTPPQNYQWVTNGPYGTGTSSNCIQIAQNEYEIGGSDDYTECFLMSDGWYYYSLRGAG